ncbi:YdjY domain-containing protein [Sulfurospirillum arcachonense]|uniref:YdjY domain-containing protein n=1 Tax=Sulfurospirillum arcachonense TaxID=57666 RepID=UPI000468915F|nr:YdjY domain-containing protein [Sulfurospirillum arcachonense]
MKKILILLTLVALFFSACQKKDDTTKSNETINGVSITNPMKIDKNNQSITILAKVNGKYLTENTRHAVVFKDGKFGDKPVFIALANQLDFYKAMIEIGGVAGNNMTKQNATKTKVEGQKVNVSVTWNGAPKSYDINEVISDSNKLPIDMRFGGNEENSKKFNTGCIACLDSCAVGIISNHTYTFGAVEKRSEVVFHGNASVLPQDGTLIAVTFKL